MRVQENKGSVSVFLAIAMSAVFAIALVLVMAFHEAAVESCADGILRLSGDSVLSEYNYYVQRDYGLFLIDQRDDNLSKKFRQYAVFSLEPMNDVTVSEGRVTAGRFSTADITSIQEQILRYMKKAGSVQAVKDLWKKGEKGNRMESRTLRHGPTIDSLPSFQLPDKNIITTAKEIGGKLTNPKAALKEGTDKYLYGSYILNHFNDDVDPVAASHFFRNEVEYILSGKLSDEENVKRVDLALKALRIAPNLAHIYADPEKTAELEVLSQTISPGVLGTATQAGLATVWATAEAVNDVRLLHKGYKVPFVKDKESWAIDLDGLVKGIRDEDVFVPDVEKGQSYRDYLRLLLFVKDENVETARIMDLIQINMRKKYDSEFLIQGCATGIDYRAKINGKEYSYDKSY